MNRQSIDDNITLFRPYQPTGTDGIWCNDAAERQRCFFTVSPTSVINHRFGWFILDRWWPLAGGNWGSVQLIRCWSTDWIVIDLNIEALARLHLFTNARWWHRRLWPVSTLIGIDCMASGLLAGIRTVCSGHSWKNMQLLLNKLIMLVVSLTYIRSGDVEKLHNSVCWTGLSAFAGANNSI